MGDSMSAKPIISTKVASRIDHPSGVMIVELEPADGAVLPPFSAGAHVEVLIEEGLTRQYSLCGAPCSDGLYRLGILKDQNSRGGSEALHARLSKGDTLKIKAPENLFPLAHDAMHVTLVGGGIGITPLIAMAYDLHEKGTPFTLHYCISDPSKAAFESELRRAPFAAQVHLHCSRSDAHPAFAAGDIPAHLNGHHIYTCGPDGFMDHVFDLGRKHGYADDALHKEFFSADVDTSGDSFEVEASQSGQIFAIGEDETIAEVLSAAGIEIAVSCEEGICGTCLTDVIEGDIDHRDQYLSDEEREEGELMLVCCSRAKSKKLVLDL